MKKWIGLTVLVLSIYAAGDTAIQYYTEHVPVGLPGKCYILDKGTMDTKIKILANGPDSSKISLLVFTRSIDLEMTYKNMRARKPQEVSCE